VELPSLMPVFTRSQFVPIPRHTDPVHALKAHFNFILPIASYRQVLLPTDRLYAYPIFPVPATPPSNPFNFNLQPRIS
jgi:hypothetical protein